MIKSFKCRDTEKLWEGKKIRQFSAFERQARRRLDILNIATSTNDLKLNRGNNFEALRGNRKGQYSIRINRQWRICFHWIDDQAENVEIIDYH